MSDLPDRDAFVLSPNQILHAIGSREVPCYLDEMTLSFFIVTNIELEKMV
jgi:hypothetical protein